MKRYFLFIILGVLLVSCAGLPAPESPGNSLVIGNLIMDFPDGFFNLPKRTFNFGVKLNFVNLTQNTKFTVSTSRGGYFYFLSNGTDKYRFESFELPVIRDSTGTYTWGTTPMNLRLSTTPDKVIYLGHVLLTYKKPEITKRTGAGEETTHWSYESSLSAEWNKDEVLQYIKQTQPDSPWLNYEVIEYKMER